MSLQPHCYLHFGPDILIGAHFERLGAFIKTTCPYRIREKYDIHIHDIIILSVITCIILFYSCTTREHAPGRKNTEVLSIVRLETRINFLSFRPQYETRAYRVPYMYIREQRSLYDGA